MRFAVLGAVLVSGTVGLALVRRALGSSSATAPLAETPNAANAESPSSVAVPDSFRGLSGALRFRTLTPAEAIDVPGFLEVLGERAIHQPAVHTVDSTFSYIVLRTFGEKKGEVLNGYRLGRWPAERWMMNRAYFNPDGFVEVTPANESLPLSNRFTLGDFVTHDQRAVWPKYVVLEEKLIDKLELVLQELTRRGIAATRVGVLSGFRAPYYNDRGVGEGMARASRHMFGDAADIYIDSDGDGRMDDLNGDGRLTLDDTRPIAAAIAAVERAHPSLVGGLGTYAAMGPRGPFAHIDVRGTSARWEQVSAGR
ncbi:MAG: hypothetical protein ACT4OZ_12580 [Gemmatimonadota bacterium]